MVEVSLTVGKLDASLAVLLTKDHHLIEFPTILLPNGVKGGSIVKIKCEHDLDTELQEKKRFQTIQDEIFSMFGKNVPKPPRLGVRNVTQTSCVLQWEPLDLGTASFKSLVLYRDDAKLFSVPNPLSNRTTKLSGLAIDKQYTFQLRLDTTAGVFLSDKIDVTTHKMTDLSGINVCVQDIAPNDQFTLDDINEALKNMGAHSPAHTKMRVDTTHYITTRENKENPEFMRANEMNVPIIRPEWLKACERERRIVGVLNFYVKDCALPTIMASNYWANSSKQTSQPSQSPRAQNTAAQPLPSVKITELSDTEETAPVEASEASGASDESKTGHLVAATPKVEGDVVEGGSEEQNVDEDKVGAENISDEAPKEKELPKEPSKEEIDTIDSVKDKLVEEPVVEETPQNVEASTAIEELDIVEVADMKAEDLAPETTVEPSVDVAVEAVETPVVAETPVVPETPVVADIEQKDEPSATGKSTTSKVAPTDELNEIKDLGNEAAKEVPEEKLEEIDLS